jgi:hypothetical protein
VYGLIFSRDIFAIIIAGLFYWIGEKRAAKP